MSVEDEGAKRALVSHGGLYLIATLAPPLASLLVTPIVTEVLDAHEYGRVAAALVGVQLLGMLLGLGVPALITREVVIPGGGGLSAARRLLNSLFLFIISAGACSLLVTVLTAPPVIPLVLTSGVVAAACGLAVFNSAQALMRGSDKVGTFVLSAFALSLVGPGCGLLLTLTWRALAESYLLGLAVGHVLTGLVGMIFLKTGMGLVPRSSVLVYLGESVPMLPHQASMYGATGLLVAMAAGFTGLGSLGAGAMQIALLAGTPPLLVLTALNNTWATQMYKVGDEGRARAVSETASVIAWFIAGVASFSAWLAPMVVAFLAPPWAFDHGAPAAAAVICLAAMVGVIYLGSVHLLFGSGKARTLWLTSPLSLTVALLCAGLLGRGGETVVEVAVGLPIFYILQAMFTYWLVRRKLVAVWKLGPLVVPSTMGCISCLAAASTFMTQTWWPLRVLMGACTAGAFAFVAYRRLRQ